MIKISALNRTIVELKQSMDASRRLSFKTLNRTIVELKRSVEAEAMRLAFSLNRTIVELKLLDHNDVNIVDPCLLIVPSWN